MSPTSSIADLTLQNDSATKRLNTAALNPRKPLIELHEVTQEVFGNPNVLVRNNPRFSEYDSATLPTEANEDYNKELVELFRGTNVNKNNEILLYFDRLRKEENQNEYNRTNINERETGKYLKNSKMKDGISVVDKLDSACHSKSYVSETKLRNLSQFAKALGGVQKMSDICFLQVRG